MSLLQLLRGLDEQGVQLWAEGGQLRYRGPQEALTPELLAGIRERKQELLTLLAQEEDPILPASRSGEIPLSFNQSQLWLLAQLRPNSSAYNEPAELQLEGDLHYRALDGALQEIVRRHEVLRTTFPVRRGQPCQEIAPALVVAFPHVDLAGLGPADRRLQLDRLESRVAQEPFDLARGPLLRLLLVRLGLREHRLLLTLHHMIHDGESMKVLASELAELYDAYRQGKPSPLPAPRVQYADFAIWQRRRVQGDLVRRQLEYWLQQLEGAQEVLQLPLDAARGKGVWEAGERRSLSLTPELTATLRQFAAAHGASLYMVLLAGWFALLHRLTGQDQISVGVPRSGRFRSTLEGMLGFVVNTQVLAVRLSAAVDLAGLLDRVREAVLGAEAHQELPFQLLLDDLRPHRHEGVHPLFQVMFAFQEDPREVVGLPGLELRLRQLSNASAKFDLDFSLVDDGRRVEGFLEYPAGLFRGATVEGFLARYQRLLALWVADPRRPLADLDLLRSQERRELLEMGGKTDSVAPIATLHGLFRQRARQTPEALALVTDTGTLSYAALDRLSDRLARLLRRQGLGLGGRAALMLDDPRDQVVALLAVLKAGGVFLFLDPASPESRRLQVLEEVNPDLVVDSAALRQALEVLPRSATEEASKEGLASEEQLPEISPESPAYLAFTSGSTGRPKGILQTHRSFGQFLSWQAREFGLGAGTRLLQWAASTYDAAYCEMLGALCFGATLCSPPRQTRHDPNALLGWLRRERVTVLQVVPSFFKLLLKTLERGSAEGSPAGLLPDLKTVLLAGEALPSDLVRRWARRGQGAPPIFNLYGPSETVLTTWFDTRDLAGNDPSMPIGRPIDGRQIVLLDRSGDLTLPRCIGRIFVRSRFLTLGYFNRPRETAESYLPDPFSRRPGGRMYNTGDLGRWSAQSVLEFHGRTDQQVKLRGIRIDLQEVEAVLSRYPGMSQCVVALRGAGELTRYIAAFLVLDGELDQEGIQSFAQHHLPQHMVPATFTQLADLPRTATGKIDRQALPATEDLLPASPPTPPRNPLEERIAYWWREELQLESLGVTDSFFSLGGNSLLAVQLGHRICEAEEVELTVAEFFENPTVAGVAQKVAQLQQAKADRMAGLLAQVNELSDQEVEELLALEEIRASSLEGDRA